MREFPNSREGRRYKVILCLLLAVIAVLSFVILGNKFTDPACYQGLNESIEKKQSDTLLLTTTVTVASAAITILPGDIATPIAEKLSDFTHYFLISLCVLFSEKYILPLVGFAVFKILVPLVCFLFALRLFVPGKEIISKIAVKVLLFSVILLVAIPVSIKASDYIYSIYESSITETIDKTNALTEDLSVFSADEEGTTFLERASDLVKNLSEALAVTVVTACIIPLLVLVFFIWLAKVLFGLDVKGWMRKAPPRIPVKKGRGENRDDFVDASEIIDTDDSGEP